MLFTLENWNTLINSTLCPAKENGGEFAPEQIQNFIKESKEEQDKVRTLFLEGILERPKVRDKQEYVKLNQAILIRLLDKLYSYKQCINPEDTVAHLYDEISHHLGSMLDFIEDFFGNYFDRNEKVPLSYLAVSLKELRRQVELLEKAVQPQIPYINAVGHVLANNFKKFCRDKKTSATYNELIYQKDLMSQLLTDDTLASEETIKEVLFYFNYNDDDFVAYLYEKLNGLIQAFQSKKEKIVALRLEQKKFNQLPSRLNCYLSSAMPPLKEQVNHWIEEEVNYLETALPDMIESHSVIPEEKEQIYFHVPFKASEIYLLLKSFIDSGGAPTETYKSLFEKTGRFLSNKTQKGFSTESLQKCSDKINYGVRENVKRFLQKMMRNIDSY